MTDDNHIILSIKENAEKGFRMLMAKYKEPIYWHIRRLVVSHDDAQDATQDTFLRIFRSFSQYSGEGSFKAWIFRIATNEALRLLGKNQEKATLSLDEMPLAALTMKADDYFDYGNTEAVKLQKAITALPAKQQLAFNLRYYDEMNYKEIANVMNISESTAKVHYHNAKQRIEQYLKEYE